MKTEIIKEGTYLTLLGMVLFLLLKVLGFINLPWWYVSIPILVCVALGVIVSLLVVIKGIFK